MIHNPSKDCLSEALVLIKLRIKIKIPPTRENCNVAQIQSCGSGAKPFGNITVMFSIRCSWYMCVLHHIYEKMQWPNYMSADKIHRDLTMMQLENSVSSVIFGFLLLHLLLC